MYCTGNILKRLQSSQWSGNKCLIAGCVSRRSSKIGYSNHLFSLLLEQYESSIYDEYSIEGEDEGSSVPPLACEFSKEKSSSHILGLVDENGYVVIYNTNKCGEQAIIKDWRAHSNAIFDLAWMDGVNKLLTAAGDQFIVLWDVPTGKKINSFHGHTSSVRSVNLKTNDSAVFATGSRDGHVMIWDVRCNSKGVYSSPVQIIRNAHSIPHLLKAKKKSKLGPSRDNHQSVTIVIYQTDMTLLSAGAVDGCVKLWDLRKNYSTSTADPTAKHTFNYSGFNKRSRGYSSLVLDSSRTQLFANCTDDIIYQYDLLNSKPVACFKGHQNKTFYVKAAISPDDQFLLSGSSNEMAYIWKIDKPNESPVVLKGHNNEVTDVSWNNNDFTKLATLSDDNTMRIWRLNRRLTARDPHEITGYSERTHREIGVSASQQVDVTPNKTSCTPKNISPSILHFLNKSAQKSNTTTVTSSNYCNISKSNDTDARTVKENEHSDKTDSGAIDRKTSDHNSVSVSVETSLNVTNNDTNESDVKSIDSKSRLPCKRKLVCDYEDENPRKRQNVRELEFQSPKKTECSGGNIVKSPWKCDENPQKWLHTSYSAASHPIGSPRKRCEVLKQISTTTSSPTKCSKSSSQSVPAHVRTNLFETFQSPTVNLPNLVVEGTVGNINVHFKQCDKENSPKMDWLTKKRLEKESESVTKDSGSSKLNKTKLISQECSLLRKDSKSPRTNKKNKSQEEMLLRKSLSSPCPSRGCNSQEDDLSLKETLPNGMKSLKHYFSVK